MKTGPDIYPATPAFHYRIKAGPIRPDDLLYAWPAGQWLRYDSPDWTGTPVTDAADAIAVVRKAKFEGPPTGWNPKARSYSVRRGYDKPAVTPDSAFSARVENAESGVIGVQKSLFD